MRIESIEITDILGTKYHRFAPGALTVIRGHNGSGKSSIIDALLSIFEGGHDPGLLRKGAKKGFIKLTLDDGTTITKTVTGKGSTVDILDAQGHIVPAPQRFIGDLAESLAADPARLLLTKQKDLLAVLLEVMPVRFDADELAREIGPEVAKLATVPARGADLDGLAAIRKQLYESRTAANRASRDADGAVYSLRQSLPEQDDKDWAAEAERLRADLAAAHQEVADVKAQATAEAVQAEHAILADYNARIQALSEERAQKVAEARKEATDAHGRLDAEAKPVLDDLTAQAAAAQERAAAQAKAAGVRESIAVFDRKAKENNILSDRLTEAMERLDALKKRKFDSLPIPGLEVQDGKVLVDGVPWEHVNTARQVELAFAICALRVGKLPFMVVDDAEHFDADTWAAFEEGALASGFQVVAARVADGPLKIEAVGAPDPQAA